MTDTEKIILEKLDGLSQEMKETKEAAQRAEATANRAAEAAERAEATANRAAEAAERAEATANRALETADKALDVAVATQLILENDISKKIDIIGEGHDFLKGSLDRALQMECKREKMELEIISLRMDVNKIKKHLDIA